MTFGKRLHELRELRFISKTKLASDLGLTRQLITQYENEKTLPTIAIFSEIADYFGVTADYLLGREFISNKESGGVYILLPNKLPSKAHDLIKELIISVSKYHIDDEVENEPST